jgi:hypothetical protein
VITAPRFTHRVRGRVVVVERLYRRRVADPRPSAKLRLALCAASSAPSAVVALGEIRRGVRAAIADLRSWRLDPDDHRQLDGRVEARAIRREYNRGVRELLARWPGTSLAD